MTGITKTIVCPCCGGSVLVTFTPEEKAIWYPNDDAYPGAPLDVDEWDGCSCVDYIEKFPGAYEDYLLETIDRLMEE